MAIASGSIVAQCMWNGGWTDYSDKAAYAGTNQSAFYTFVLKFTAPEFAGVSKKLRFRLGMTKGAGTDITLRWALCASDANKNSYLNTNGAVTDSNQISSGTMKATGLSTAITYQQLEISTGRVKAGGTYYLILWGYNPQSSPAWCTVNNTSYGSVTLESVAGIVRLVRGGNAKSYAVVVKRSGKLYLAMVGIVKKGSFYPGA